MFLAQLAKYLIMFMSAGCKETGRTWQLHRARIRMVSVGTGLSRYLMQQNMEHQQSTDELQSQLKWCITAEKVH